MFIQSNKFSTGKKDDENISDDKSTTENIKEELPRREREYRKSREQIEQEYTQEKEIESTDPYEGSKDYKNYIHAQDQYRLL